MTIPTLALTGFALVLRVPAAARSAVSRYRWEPMTSGKQSRRKRRQAAAAARRCAARAARRGLADACSAPLPASPCLSRRRSCSASSLTRRIVRRRVRRPTATQAPRTRRGARRLFEGIPQHGNVLGYASAPVTMVEYVDLQCPYCRAFETEVMPTMIRRYVRTGKLKVEARPLAFIGPDSERGRARAASRPASRTSSSTSCSCSTATRAPRTAAGSTMRWSPPPPEHPGLDVPALLEGPRLRQRAGHSQALDAQATADGALRHADDLHRQDRRRDARGHASRHPNGGPALGGARLRTALNV